VSSIKVAKERRELLRKTGVSGEDDFISLSVVRRSEDQGPHPESRLMREEDEVGDADDGLYTVFHSLNTVC
jgi:GC-rich sequence DNA-binding factor